MIDFIRRNTPKIAGNFTLKYTETPPDGSDYYEIYSEDGKIVLAGNSNLSLAMAYYRYLNEYCSVVITSGEYDISSIYRSPLPEKKITYTAPQKIRARISYEMFSLSGNFWGFDRWEKEIDFMAMHGINAALQTVGFEAVTFYTLTDLGMDKNFCAEFASGPAFISRQVTGNIAGIHSINSIDYIEKKLSVAKMINDRERQLGIEPIFPAAMPSVPFSLRKKYTKMDIFKAPQWYNLPPIFYIEPDNGFFSVFNRKFLETQRELLGETHSYIFEPAYDVDKKGYNAYFKNLGPALSQLLDDFDSEAVCYTHASSVNENFFENMAGKKFIFIDDCNAVSGNLLDGKKFIVDIGGNKYGRTGLYGNIDKLCKNPYAQAKAVRPDVCGSCISIDSFDENPMFCACALESIKRSQPFDCEEFLRDFAEKRYSTDKFDSAVIKLKEICYNTDECAGSIICARPATELKHTAPYDNLTDRNIDFHALYELAREITDSDEAKNDEMRADIQSIVRQILSELAYPVYLKATESFKQQNVGLFEQLSNLFLEICKDMDRLLKTRKETNLFTHIEEARQLGSDKDEIQSLEINYLMLLTIWGPIDHSMLYDTVWREWGGFVEDFYAQRWYMYYHSLAAYFDKPKKLKDVSKRQPLDRNEYQGSYQAKRLTLFENNFIENYIPKSDGIAEEDALTVAKELLHKYSEVIYQF
ncbi:MAG: alpha-N-acetylglucosaminidase TIM-barrel domain-containing protein [Clostridia bacterium]|nr:alpha-N-acetylglucosaminidase TIM-barrel domain-containing protein [Clostridia bacterium]